MNQLRIAYCSDLHLEFDDRYLTVAKNKSSRRKDILLETGLMNTCQADVLVLAGDIISAPLLTYGSADKFFEITSKEFKVIIMIFGNHDYYHGYLSNSVKTAKNYLKAWENIHILDSESIEIDGISFFGATLWTNMGRANPIAMMRAARSLNDYNYIFVDDESYSQITSEIILEQHNTSMEKLKEFLAQNKPSVVISHHPPSIHSVEDKYKNGMNDITNLYYYSDLDYLMYWNQNIIAWIHGHCHNNSDYVINNTRILCNPRGYIGQERIADNFVMKYFDITMKDQTTDITENSHATMGQNG
jgi:predicted MPP superfamily phosphohydrolase